MVAVSKWNNESVVTNITPSYNFNSAYRGLSPPPTMYSKIYQQNFQKATSTKSIFKVGSYESLWTHINTCKEICILESCSVSIHKMFEMQMWSNFFFQFTIILVIFVTASNAPLLICLTPASENHFLETIIKTKQFLFFTYLL